MIHGLANGFHYRLTVHTDTYNDDHLVEEIDNYDARRDMLPTNFETKRYGKIWSERDLWLV